MSLLPFILSDLTKAPASTHHHFGLGVHPHELHVSPHFHHAAATPAGYLRNWVRSELAHTDGAEKETHIGKDGFQVCLDVQHFAPNEITVKIVDNSIVVDAKHEERQDNHGYISRQFTRRYDLPKRFNALDVVSTVSSDGVLTIKAPPANQTEGNVRHVQIQQVGPAHLNVANKPAIKQNDKK